MRAGRPDDAAGPPGLDDVNRVLDAVQRLADFPQMLLTATYHYVEWQQGEQWVEMEGLLGEALIEGPPAASDRPAGAGSAGSAGDVEPVMEVLRALLGENINSVLEASDRLRMSQPDNWRLLVDILFELQVHITDVGDEGGWEPVPRSDT